MDSETRARVAAMLCNLDANRDVRASLLALRDTGAWRMDGNLAVLVLQKIHGILLDSYDAECVRTAAEMITTERAVDELFKIYFSFEDREDLVGIIASLKDRWKMVLFKYLADMKRNVLLSAVVEDMEREYVAIVDSIL